MHPGNLLSGQKSQRGEILLEGKKGSLGIHEGGGRLRYRKSVRGTAGKLTHNRGVTARPELQDLDSS